MVGDYQVLLLGNPSNVRHWYYLKTSNFKYYKKLSFGQVGYEL